jgi:hypothetical protein
MSPPLSASRVITQLKTFGVNVRTHGKWTQRNRNHMGKWGPVNGVMLHHTVTSGTTRSLEILTDGYSGLPGPLCHGMIDKDGTVHMVGWGRTNHAGLGDQKVLNAVITESAMLPPPRFQTVDGNRRFYGFECVNLGNGTDPWPEEQVEAMCRASAALCKAHGWSERSVIGHLEWQTGKVDPRGLSMAALRERIRRLLSPDVTYTIRKGDTLWSIAEDELGNGARWTEIAALNPGTDPENLVPGTALKIPKN